jgi:hypothetical protein
MRFIANNKNPDNNSTRARAEEHTTSPCLTRSLSCNPLHVHVSLHCSHTLTPNATHLTTNNPSHTLHFFLFHGLRIPFHSWMCGIAYNKNPDNNNTQAHAEEHTTSPCLSHTHTHLPPCPRPRVLLAWPSAPPLPPPWPPHPPGGAPWS